jgi:RimJ/RimL family protein N-acetyltransferase
MEELLMELNKNQFSEVELLFKELTHHISIKGVIQGYIEGRVFSDINRSAAVAITPQGIFLSDGQKDEAFLKEMNKVLKKDILPKYEDKGKLDYVVFYAENNSSERALKLLLQGLYPMKSKRLTFSKDMVKVENVLPEGIFPVDSELLNKKDLPGIQGVIDEILGGWISVEDFISKGFGCVSILDKKIIGWCLTDWVVGDECEVGIETYPEYRKQGVGSKLAKGTLALAKNKGIKRVGWQCWFDNEGSKATAKSVGFKLVKEFEVNFAWANKLNNMLINGNHYMLNNTCEADFAFSARCYAAALDKGWDWGGNCSLYWNCACMYYKSGDREKAKHYYRMAVEKGWQGYEPYINNPYVYKEDDSKEILTALTVES